MMMPKLFGAILTLSGLAILVGAQVIYDIETNNFWCPATGGRYCAATSLTSNIIVRCAGYIGDPEDCRNQLYYVFPLSIKDFAPCYQLDPTIGDAACSLNGTAYPVDGEPFPIPGDIGLEATRLAHRSIANESGAASPDSDDKPRDLESLAVISQVELATTTSSEVNIYTRTVTEEIVCQPRPISQTQSGGNVTAAHYDIVRPSSQSESGATITTPPGISDSGVPVPLIGGVHTLAKSNNSSNAPSEHGIEGTGNSSSVKPEFATNGTGILFSITRELVVNGTTNSSRANPDGTAHGTGSIERAAPTLALYTGSGSKHELEMCAFGAGLIAAASFVLVN